jgi:hypothetical protein
MTENLRQFTHDAREANAEIWDERMGDEGNDFFKLLCPPLNKKGSLFERGKTKSSVI